MFQFRFALLVVLIPLAGLLALLGGTSVMHGIVMTPYEAAASASSAAAVGVVARFSGATVEAATLASSDADVHAALIQKKKTTAAEAPLLAKAGMNGMFGAPAFALLVAADDGTVVGSYGIDSKLPATLAGFPIVAEALTGLARDGLVIQDGKPVHLVGAPVYKDGNKPIGCVLLGWPWSTELVDSLQRTTGTSFFIVGAGNTSNPTPIFSIGTPVVGVEAEALAAGVPFGDRTQMYGPLPILVPDQNRFTVATSPLYPGDPSFSLAVLTDRDQAYEGLAAMQAGILGLTFLLGVLVLSIVVITMRSVARPLEIILNHLAKAKPGSNVGILPEAGLSGPFLRLGKQINNILHAAPSARSAGPVAPMFNPAYDTAPPETSPLEPPGPFSRFPSQPGLSSPPTFVPTVSASFSPSFVSAGSSLPGLSPPSFGAPPTFSPNASEPPAVTPTGGLRGLFDDGPDPLAAFRVPPKPTNPIQPPPQPPVDAPHEMNPEATVMFQVPSALLEASVAEARKSEPPHSAQRTPPPPPGDSGVDDARTIVAQVPHDLLAQHAPRNNLDAAESTHYKEVYEKFVQTRIECGEDTSDLNFDRFVAKLLKNRQQIIEKHKAKSVRFQVYVKDGKAALRALPVRD